MLCKSWDFARNWNKGVQKSDYINSFLLLVAGAHFHFGRKISRTMEGTKYENSPCKIRPTFNEEKKRQHV